MTVEDLRGDLHSHTTASDGTASIEEMARAARAAGYEYLAVTDHSASFGFGDEVSPTRLREQIARIRELSESDEVDGITLLAGSEVNILPDGSLDYDDEVLAELDWVVASVHSSFAMAAPAMTERIVRAIANPLVDVIGHLSGARSSDGRRMSSTSRRCSPPPSSTARCSRSTPAPTAATSTRFTHVRPQRRGSRS